MEATAVGIESSGLDMLDIVKHAVKTIIKTLSDTDRLGIVDYSNSANICFELFAMDPVGKDRAIRALEKLQPDGMTNLWDGLKTAMKMLYERDENLIFNNVPSNSRNSAIYLLTDGVPNIDPPRGYVDSMKRVKDQNKGQYPGVINTFGFGYNLKSDLLLSIAQEGQGNYAFIPDSGFVGTIFVNALGNTLTTMGNETTISISAEDNDAKLIACDSSDIEVQVSPDSLNYKGRTIQIGQPCGAVFEMDKTELPLVFSKLSYTNSATKKKIEISVTGPDSMIPTSDIDVQEIAAEYFRCSTIGIIQSSIVLCNQDKYDECKSKLTLVIDNIKEWLSRNDDCGPKIIPGEMKSSVSAYTRIQGLLED